MPDRSVSKSETVCGGLSVLLPLALYVATATPAPGWLDSSEFLATGFVLGAAHPPGHPVLVTLIKLISLIPLGPLAFRASLASAVPAALASLLTFKLFLAISREVDRRAQTWIRSVFGLISALMLAVTPALWGEAVRAEVYAAQLALVLGGMVALVRFGLGPRGERDGRLLTAAALAFGLSLANHHFLSLLLLPGVIVLLTEDALGGWRRTLKLLGKGVVPGIAVGMIPYAHLVLRAGAPGAVSLGASPDPATFFWVVSARAYQKSVVEPPTSSFGERLVDAAMLMTSQLGPLVVILALGALYFLVRQRWALGTMMLLWIVATWLARAWLGVDPGVPDVLGYLLVPICLLALGAGRSGPLIATIIPGRPTVRVGLAFLVASALLAGLGLKLVRRWPEQDLSDRRESAIVARAQLDDLPPRSVLITELFSTGFNVWAVRTVEGARPDLAHFHFPFVGYPGYVSQVHRENPDLRDLLRMALATGELSEDEVSALAQRRAVFLEPMIHEYAAIEPFLLPRGLVWEASAEPLGLTDVELAVTEHFDRWDLLLARLGDGVTEEQTLRVVLWRLYIDALLLARRGARDGARGVVDRALGLAPFTPELLDLRLALEQGEGPLDVTPYLPRGRRPAASEEPETEEEAGLDVLEF